MACWVPSNLGWEPLVHTKGTHLTLTPHTAWTLCSVTSGHILRLVLSLVLEVLVRSNKGSYPVSREEPEIRKLPFYY